MKREGGGSRSVLQKRRLNTNQDAEEGGELKLSPAATRKSLQDLSHPRRILRNEKEGERVLAGKASLRATNWVKSRKQYPEEEKLPTEEAKNARKKKRWLNAAACS